MLKFEIQTEDSSAPRTVEKTIIVMESVIALNQLWLRAHPNDICFLSCDVIHYDFARENLLSDVVDIKTIPILKKTRKGLCIDFVCFDLAVRRMTGEQAFPKVSTTGKDGVFHIQTKIIEGDEVRVVDPAQEIVDHGNYKSIPAICSC
jgi:hypothetical protein